MSGRRPDALVDSDLFIEIYDQLSAHYRQQGLTGRRLDKAMVEALPHRLEQILDGSTVQDRDAPGQPTTTVRREAAAMRLR